MSRPEGDAARLVAAKVDGAASAGSLRPDPITIHLDDSVLYNSYDTFGPVDTIVLGTGRDEAEPTAHTYFLQLNNADFNFGEKKMVVDGSALAAGDFSGETPLFDESAYVSTYFVTAYDAKITTGAANDTVVSGSGSDWVSTGDGDDYVAIATGTDTVYAGRGNDYIDSTYGDLTTADLIDGGSGRDEVSVYYQDLGEAEFARMKSIEIIGMSSGGNLTLGTEAARNGVNELFIDDTRHKITVEAGFTGPLTVNMMGNFNGKVSLDASASSAAIIIHADYGPVSAHRNFIGGTSADDTFVVTSGFAGLPAYGGDLTRVTHFEHVVVQTGTGDAGATVLLATRAGQIDAAFQTVDASTLGTADPLTLRADAATASLHVTAGTGADIIFTGKGADRIDGGLGSDLITGGAGRDVIVYHSADDSNRKSVDVITDFQSGSDKVDVTGLGESHHRLSGEMIAFFGNMGGGADFKAAFAATAGDGELDAVFRTDTHTLWFDTNDNGVLDGSDLHVLLADVSALKPSDVLAGAVVA